MPRASVIVHIKQQYGRKNDLWDLNHSTVVGARWAGFLEKQSLNNYLVTSDIKVELPGLT